MRAKRAKAYKKVMQFYQQNFGFREPYQILVSPDFVLEGVAKNIDVAKALEEAVGGKVRLLITFCGICDVRKDGPHRGEAIKQTKAFEKRRCQHKTPIAASDCISEIMGESNKHNYCIAAQDDALRLKMRQIAGVPIMHVSHSVVVLEHIPKRAKELLKEKEQATRELSELEQKMLKTVKTEAREAKAAAIPQRQRKKMRAKGPNPLSVKKSKKANANAAKQTPKAGAKRSLETQDGSAAPTAKKEKTA
ncbi:hypothetical protein H4S01_002894 [Coemansia sp. RSA 2610]|nr:hypothetical protein H4S01_002894 [Coemansia sp. RSA 2610]